MHSCNSLLTFAVSNSVDELFNLFSANKVQLIKDPLKAIQMYKLSQKTDTLIIAGSHYLGPIISKEFKISFENI